MSVKDKWTVNGLKPYLMEILKVNSSADPYLRSIVSVFDDGITSTNVNDKLGQGSGENGKQAKLIIYSHFSLFALIVCYYN